MPDPTYTQADVTEFAQQYSKLLAGPAGGHALFSPQKSETGGGQVGDIGYIDAGMFWKVPDPDSNVLASGGPLEHLASQVQLKEFNKPTMKSCIKTGIKFEITGSAGFKEAPLDTINVQPRITFSNETDAFAFLAPVKPTRWELIAPEACTEIGIWLGKQVRLDRFVGKFIVTGALQSSGHIGGLRVSRAAPISAGVGFSFGDGPSSSVGGSIEDGQKLHVKLRGPEDWVTGSPAAYSIVLNYTLAITRSWLAEWLSSPVSVPSSASQSGSSTGTPSASSTSQTGTQANPGSAAQQGHQSTAPPGSAALYSTPLMSIFRLIFEQHGGVYIAAADLRTVCEFLDSYPIAPGEPTTIRVKAEVAIESAPRVPEDGDGPAKVIGVLKSLGVGGKFDGTDFTIEPAWIRHTTRYMPHVGKNMVHKGENVIVTEVHPEKSSVTIRVRGQSRTMLVRDLEGHGMPLY